MDHLGGRTAYAQQQSVGGSEFPLPASESSGIGRHVVADGDAGLGDERPDHLAQPVLGMSDVLVAVHEPGEFAGVVPLVTGCISPTEPRGVSGPPASPTLWSVLGGG